MNIKDYSFTASPKYYSFLKRYLKKISYVVIIYSVLYLFLYLTKMPPIGFLLFLSLPALSLIDAFFRLKHYILHIEIKNDYVLIDYVKYSTKKRIEGKIEDFDIKKLHVKYNNLRDFYLLIINSQEQVKFRQYQTLDWKEENMDDFLNAYSQTIRESVVKPMQGNC